MNSNVLSKKSKKLLCVTLLIVALVACSLVITLSSKLYVEAEEVKTYVLTQAGKYNINDANAIVDFSGADALTEMRFFVQPDVQKVKFIGGGTFRKSFKNINVVIRSTQLHMVLENVNIFGNYDSAGINASLCPKLILEVIGSNGIAAGTVTSLTGVHVGGIMCRDIDIIGSGSLSVEGSEFNMESFDSAKKNVNGANGQHGLYISRENCSVNISVKSVVFKGGNAGNALKGADITITPKTPDKAEKGKDGTQGTKGENGNDGGNGGNGGAGIYAKKAVYITISSDSTVSFIGGNGTNGADGGNGGRGGNGGEGADAAPFVYGTVGGKGGNGGNGGNGGYPGLAGKPYENCIIVGNYIATSGKAGQTGGKGGKGGEGGEGGLGGWRLDKKYRWASGAKGERGDDGIDRSV